MHEYTCVWLWVDHRYGVYIYMYEGELSVCVRDNMYFVQELLI